MIRGATCSVCENDRTAWAVSAEGRFLLIPRTEVNTGRRFDTL